MALTSAEADGILRLTTERGGAWFAVDESPGLPPASFGIYAGDILGEMFDASIHYSERAIGLGRTVVICDALYVRRYESAFRERWVGWFLKHRHQVEGLHFSIADGLPKMGLQVLGLAIPNFAKAYDSDADLDVLLGPRRAHFQRLRALRDAWRSAHST